MSIRDECTRLLCDIYPAPGGQCALTHKRRKAFEKLYFTAYRSCFTMIMLTSDKPEEEAKKTLDGVCDQLDCYFRDLENSSRDNDNHH
jgi:DNA-binding Xre family transcriptional regulator